MQLKYINTVILIINIFYFNYKVEDNKFNIEKTQSYSVTAATGTYCNHYLINGLYEGMSHNKQIDGYNWFYSHICAFHDASSVLHQTKYYNFKPNVPHIIFGTYDPFYVSGHNEKHMKKYIIKITKKLQNKTIKLLKEKYGPEYGTNP